MRLSSFIIALFWFVQSFAQTGINPSSKFQQITKSESTPQWMTLKEDVNLTSEELVADKGLLNLSNDDELLKVSTTTDELGYEHQRYLQHYKGIPIEDAWYIVHAKDGKALKANGKLLNIGELGIEAVLTPEKALNGIVANNKSYKYAWMDARVEEDFKKIANDPTATFHPKGELLITKNAEKEYTLAYRFEIFSLDPYHVEAVFVDANNGVIIKKEDLLHQAHECSAHAEEDELATGSSNYSGTVQFTTEAYGGTYRLRNDVGGTLNSNNGDMVDITDTDNNWTDDPTAVDVHWGIEKTYDYFLSKHNRDSYDNNGSPVAAWVHFGNNANIAGWNNICSCMIFGDGDGENFNSATSLDIVAHEYAHGVTRYASSLKYYNESGALNESFSDIFGTLIEQQYHPDGGNWIIGEDIVAISGKGGLRNLANPKDPKMKRPQPDTYMGEYWYTGQLDNGGVHTNSGVHNHWFYLLAYGGSGVNDNGIAYHVEGIGTEKAAEIAYRNLTVYLHSDSNYEDARLGSIQASKDLFGMASFEFIQTQKAWCAVGLGSACSSFTPTCRTRDSLALVDVYHAAEGDTWRYSWNLNNSMSTWRGVTLNGNGCVSRLDFSNRKLKGDLSPSIGNLLDLVFFKIHQNTDFTGTIPPEIGNLTNLEDLYLYNNSMTGDIPEEIGNLLNLDVLYLTYNQFTGDVPSSFNNLTNLRYLNIGTNRLKNMPDLTGMSSMYSFVVRNNYFTFEHILPNVSMLASHQYRPQKKVGATKTILLNFGENYTIKLNIDADIANNTYRWYKDGVLVGTTNVDEFTVPDFSDTDIGIYTCAITNPGATALTLESYPVTLQSSSDNCRLRDSLALVEFYHATNGDNWYTTAKWYLDEPMDEWYGLTFNQDGCVTGINIPGNKRLIGHIPAEIGNLLSLETLKIKRNDFSNTSIPPEIGNLTNLKTLELSYSNLSGSIPPEIGNLANIRSLNLYGNNLSGNIPPEIGNLSNLYLLYLGNNQLTGAIPTEFSNLNALTHLILSNNRLSDLPIINHINASYFHATNNHFTFKDILPHVDLMDDPWDDGRYYYEQLPLGEARSFTFSPGDQLNIDLDIDHNITGNIYRWYKDGTLIQTINDNPIFQKTIQNASHGGIYTCQITNAGVPHLTLYSQPYTVEFEPITSVYPGDLNNDGRVDGSDALFWGLTYSRTGIQRPSNSTDWTPQPCPNWNIYHFGVNGKHQDANGDGTVNEADLEVVENNYGQNAELQDFFIEQAPLSLTYTLVSSEPHTMGKTKHTFNLSLVNNFGDNTPISIHGLSFAFKFESGYENNYSSSAIDLTGSPLSNGDSLAVVHQEYAEESRAAYTITRKDLNDMKIEIGGSTIVKLIVIADDHQTGDPNSFVLKFQDIKASSASYAGIMSLDAVGATIPFRLKVPSIIGSISPNPTQAAQGISLTLNADTDYGNGHIIVTDMMGKTITRQPIELSQGTQHTHLATDGLPSGIYTLHLIGSGWHSQAERFIISQ